MVGENLFAAQQGRRTEQALVVCLALIVSLSSLGLAWAGASANYQARVERERLERLALPVEVAQPKPHESSIVVYGYGTFDGVGVYLP
jgi:hypothetical protein